MSIGNITKIPAFVISVFVAIAFAGCGLHVSSEREREQPLFDRDTSPYEPPKSIGTIRSDEINESSGLAASRCQPDVLWTHNDSGDGPFLYAFDSTGRSLGTWRVAGADNRDWEDMATVKDAAGQCFLYIGEIGNNEGKRDRTLVYRVKEPAIAGQHSTSGTKGPLSTEPAESISVNYPGPRENAEALLVHPASGDIYIVSKRFDGPAAVYRVPPGFGSSTPVAAQKVTDIAVPAILNGLITGGDISPDGTRLVLADYVAGYEYTLPNGADEFDDIWKQQPIRFDIGKRKNGEAIAYSADGSSLFSTSEGKNSPIFEMKRR